MEHPIDTFCDGHFWPLRTKGVPYTLRIGCWLTEEGRSWWMLVEVRDLGFLLP